jgi:hypothetical protein
MQLSANDIQTALKRIGVSVKHVSVAKHENNSKRALLRELFAGRGAATEIVLLVNDNNAATPEFTVLGVSPNRKTLLSRSMITQAALDNLCKEVIVAMQTEDLPYFVDQDGFRWTTLVPCTTLSENGSSLFVRLITSLQRCGGLRVSDLSAVMLSKVSYHKTLVMLSMWLHSFSDHFWRIKDRSQNRYILGSAFVVKSVDTPIRPVYHRAMYFIASNSNYVTTRSSCLLFSDRQTVMSPSYWAAAATQSKAVLGEQRCRAQSKCTHSLRGTCLVLLMAYRHCSVCQ